jgi:hypothetical protein
MGKNTHTVLTLKNKQFGTPYKIITLNKQECLQGMGQLQM